MVTNNNKINYINGIRLHRAIVAGIRSVIEDQDYLNKINVFPVPDGDTGTNMAFTMTAILDGTANRVHSRVDEMLSIIADSALDGARGNSGAILAQFFQGFSDGVADYDRLTTTTFVKAIKTASEYARDALAEPVEGTILTVIEDFSKKIHGSVDEGVDDFTTLLNIGVAEAERSLENTPNLMEVLKKAGVVDAGAKGFVDFLQGIHNYIREGSLREADTFVPIIQTDGSKAMDYDPENLSYQYCTECLIMGEEIDHRKLREELIEMGDSIVLAGSIVKTKVHIHTNEPAEVFTKCDQFGVVTSQKADDMHQQQEISHGGKMGDTAIVTDSGADFNDDELDIHVVPVRYNFGKKGYIDKISQSTAEFYKELSSNPVHPQTSQPVPGDFRRQYQFLNTHYKSIISIHIPQAVSGTLQSAQTAAKRLLESRITIMDSNNVSVGMGLLVTYAATLAKEGKNHDEIVAGIEKAREVTQVYAGIKDLSYAVKGGRVPESKKIVANLLNLRPVLTTSHEGTL